MNIKKKLIKCSLLVKKASPFILVGCGVVGFGATCYSASKALKPVDKEIQGMENLKDHYESSVELVEIDGLGVPYASMTKEEYYSIRRNHIKNIIVIVAPTVALGISSTACIIGSAVIMNNRIKEAVAILTTVQAQQAFVIDSVKSKGKKYEKCIANYEYTIKNGKEIVTSEVYDNMMTCGSFCEKPFELSRFFTDNLASDNEKLFHLQIQAYELAFDQGYITYNQLMELLGMNSVQGGSAFGWLRDLFTLEDYIIHEHDVDSPRLIVEFPASMQMIDDFTGHLSNLLEDDDMFDNCDDLCNPRQLAMNNYRTRRGDLF